MNPRARPSQGSSGLSMNRTRRKRRGSKTRRKTRGIYTKGELNKLIDSVCHPIYETDKRFILLDGFLHVLVERDPPASVRKFVKYNLPEIVKLLSEKRQSQ